jgi:hypothetical protein
LDDYEPAARTVTVFVAMVGLPPLGGVISTDRL